MAPAKTGRERRSNIAVIKIDHRKRVILSKNIPEVFILIIVVIKFTAPRIDEIPAKWREKIDKSTALPEWVKVDDKGG